MRAASPPANASDILEATNNRRNNRPGIKRSMMAKQNSLDDVGLELEGEEPDEDFDTDAGTSLEQGFGRDSPRPGTPVTEKGSKVLSAKVWHDFNFNDLNYS